MNKKSRKIAIFLIVIFTFFIISELKEIAGLFNNLIATFRYSNTVKRLIIGRANDAISLDPANTTEMDSFKVTVNIFDTLVKYEKEGSKIVPGLAESWKFSEDGLTWEFKLRQGIQFHDGTTFNASAVTFNFQRWMDAKNPYHIGQFSYWNYIFGGFPGFVESVNTISEYLVQIKLSKPYAPFLSALAMPVFGIASPEAIRKYGDESYKNPVGTGPFSFKSWERDNRIVLLRNEKYWNGIAKVNEVEYRVIPSSKDRLEELRNGNIHIADNLLPDDAAEIKYDPDLYLYLRPSFNVGYLAMNNDKPPFNIQKVRIAINHGIDKDKLINEVFDNMAKPANTYIPPYLWGYNENLELYEYNPEKAKRLLAEAGFPGGFKTTLWVMDSAREYFPKPLQAAEFIRENLMQINIDAEIKVFNWNEYLKMIQNGEHEMAMIGWTGDFVDPDNFLYTMLASENAKPGMAGNYSFYRSKETDQLLAQARQTTNIVFRRSLYRSLQEIVNYDSPSVPLVYTMPVLASRLSVKGYTPHMTGVESLENVDIELE